MVALSQLKNQIAQFAVVLSNFKFLVAKFVIVLFYFKKSFVEFALRLVNCFLTAQLWELPAICLPHQNVEIPLSAFPNGTTSNLAGLFSTLSL